MRRTFVVALVTTLTLSADAIATESNCDSSKSLPTKADKLIALCRSQRDSLFHADGSTAGLLNAEGTYQECLSEDHDYGDENIVPSALPECRLPVLDDCVCRQRRCRDVKALKRAPVYMRLKLGVMDDCNVLRWFA